MATFIDTSAFLAFINDQDCNHPTAATIWAQLIETEEALFCSNYVIIETFTLLQRRLGILAARGFYESIVPLLIVEWVDETIHQAALSAVLTANRRKLSLVDCTSFEIMRRLAIKNVFTFDKHFSEQGFHQL